MVDSDDAKLQVLCPDHVVGSDHMAPLQLLLFMAFSFHLERANSGEEIERGNDAVRDDYLREGRTRRCKAQELCSPGIRS